MGKVKKGSKSDNKSEAIKQICIKRQKGYRIPRQMRISDEIQNNQKAVLETSSHAF